MKSGVMLKDWFRGLANKATERLSVKSKYAAAVAAAEVAQKYVIIYDQETGELEIIDKTGYLLCWGYDDHGAFDCVVDFPTDLMETTVKRHVVSKYDDTEAVAV